MSNMNRREMMGGVLAGAASAAMLTGTQAHAKAAAKPGYAYPNSHFYKSDGSFDAKTAKEAFYEMFEHFGYPAVPKLRTDEFWVADFGVGEFTEVGMGGIFWLNLKEQNYFGHEIYLLPGQMIPEHRHVRTPDAAPKMESWHVRYGSVHIYGEGTPTPGVEARIPQTHRECCIARTEKQLMPGEIGHLGGPEQWHWMKAGGEGAIVTEYATYHDNAALRFTLDKVVF